MDPGRSRTRSTRRCGSASAANGAIRASSPGTRRAGSGRRPTAATAGLRQTPACPPPQSRGRIGLDISRSNPRVALRVRRQLRTGRCAANRESATPTSGRLSKPRIKGAEIYRSDDKGARWRQVSEPNAFMVRPLRHLRLGIRPDPRRSLGRQDHLYARPRLERVARRREDVHRAEGSARRSPRPLDRSRESLDSVQRERRRCLHVDRWRRRVEICGVCRRCPHFTTWRWTASVPAWAYGSIQDVGSRRGRVDLTHGRDHIPAVDWTNAPGGEGSRHSIDPNELEHGVFAHVLRKFHPRRREQPAGAGCQGKRRTKAARAEGAGHVQHARYARRIPICAASGWRRSLRLVHKPGLIYAAFQFVFRSPDRGDTWERISADLSDNDPA